MWRIAGKKRAKKMRQDGGAGFISASLKLWYDREAKYCPLQASPVTTGEVASLASRKGRHGDDGDTCASSDNHASHKRPHRPTAFGTSPASAGEAGVL
ncbi:hypothetical protein AXE86_04455 [Selenomonas sp. oral taxon 136]|nr:hypothetical protein AXE86_04455 [Selenomonas sp. oral taxon 136]